MTRILIYVFTITVIITAVTGNSFGCTTFCLKNGGEVLFGKNYDWMIGDGFVFVNKRGVAKMSADNSEKNPAKWTSKYGSVTFNQYGWESPSGGMNEAGLVIELMWLDDTEWPTADDRPALGVLEWIQFNLDTASTIQEVIANSDKVRITSRVKLHYLVNDKAGNTATVEYLNGKLVVHTGKDLEFAALTNDTYSHSLEYVKQTGSTAGESSLSRFTRAASRSAEFSKKPKTEKESVDYAFSVLADVAQKNSTQWSIVYDQKRGKIHFRTRKSPEIKTIDTASFDYSCGSAVKMFDMNTARAGEIAGAFVDYSRSANRDLIEQAFTGTDFLRNIPAAVKNHYADFPESFRCWSLKDVRVATDPTTGNYSLLTFAYYFNPAFLLYRAIFEKVSS